MQDRELNSQAVVDFDFDETGKIVKAEAQRPKAAAESKTLEEIRQQVLAMGVRKQQRTRFWSRPA